MINPISGRDTPTATTRTRARTWVPYSDPPAAGPHVAARRQISYLAGEGTCEMRTGGPRGGGP